MLHSEIKPVCVKAFVMLAIQAKGNKKAPVKVEGNLMFTQRNNPLL